MFGAVLASVAGSVISGALSKDSTDDAVSAQTQSADQAIGEQQRQFDLNRKDLAPWRSAGGAAVGDLSRRLGLKSATASGWEPGLPTPAGADDLATWAQKHGYDLPQGGRDWNQGELANLTPGYRQYLASIAPAQGAEASDPEFGSLLRKFSIEDFNNDPVIQKQFEFGKSEGEKAVQRMFGARGMGRSGAAIKAATRFATDYTGQSAGQSRDRYVQDQTNLFNRLSGVAGTGQTAATNTAQMGTQAANNISDINIGTGNARGAAAIAGGRAMGGAASSAGNSVGGMFTLDRILNSGINGPLPGYVPQVQGSVPGQFNLDSYG